MNNIAFILFNNCKGGVDKIVQTLLDSYPRADLFCNSDHNFYEEYCKIYSERVICTHTITSTLRKIFKFKIGQRYENLVNRYTHGVLQLILGLTLNWGLRNKLKKYSHIIFIFGGFPSSDYLFSTYILLPKCAKITVYIHNDNSLNKSILPKVKFNIYLKILEKHAPNYIWVSAYSRSTFVSELNTTEKIKDRLFTIYNPCKINGIKRTRKIINNKFTIGLLGNYEPRKGHLLLIEALTHCKNKHLIEKVVFYGDGSSKYINKLKNAIKINELEHLVEFHPFSDNNYIYSQCDFTVIPSISYESFGLVQVESIIFGCPCIVTDSLGPGEIAKLIENPLIFEHLNSLDLAFKLEDVLGHFQFYLNHIPNSVALIKKNLSIDTYLFNLEKAIF